MTNEEQLITEKYAIYRNDCVPVVRKIPDASIHLSIYSPPFATPGGGALYHYSSHERDFSNCDTYQQFWEMYNFLLAELFRATVPGRITAVHCTDVPRSNTGRDAVTDFPGDIIRLHCRCRDSRCDAEEIDKAQGLCGHGWFDYTGRRIIWKEPLAVRNRTMQHNLSHKTIVEDGTLGGVASADQLLIFRRKGTNPIPVQHPTGLVEYAGERQVPAELQRYRGWAGDQTKNRYSHWIWRQYASSVWDDITGLTGKRVTGVLPFRAARDSEDEKHVHPLQLDVIHRCVVLYSNPGETVLTPFMGVGSEVFESVRLGRRAIGIELKPSYYRQAVKNLATVEEEYQPKNEVLPFGDEWSDEA